MGCAGSKPTRLTEEEKAERRERMLTAAETRNKSQMERGVGVQGSKKMLANQKSDARTPSARARDDQIVKDWAS